MKPDLLERAQKIFQRSEETPSPLAANEDAGAPDEATIKRRWRLVWISAGALTVIGIVIFLVSHVFNEQPPPNTAAAVSQTQVVSVVQVSQHGFSPHVSLLGEVRPKRDIHVFAPASGVRVLQLLADEGDYVRAGQPLARLDTAVANAQTSAAQANVAGAESDALRARDEYQRAESIRDSGALSAEQIEQRHAASVAADAKLAAARAQYAEINARLGGGYVRAPVAGLVISRSVQLGAMVDQQEMFRIAGDNQLEVSAQVSETDMLALAHGQQAAFRLADGTNVQGRLSRLPASINERTRTGEALFDLPRDTRVRAGMHLSGDVNLSQREALAVPQDAIRYEDSRAFVFVVLDGRVHKTYITTGSREGNMVEVVNGLNGGAAVVGSGAAFLRDGDPVRSAGHPAPAQQSGDAEQLRGLQQG
ncbi:MAG: efflux RND transporter periplasmic adaptor subunit [Terricaulis sp.]